jgi:hypothetical protein
MGSPVPTAGMIATRIMELRRRRGLMITLILLNIGFPALFLFIRLLLHAFVPRTSPPAGGNQIFGILTAGFLPTFGFIVAATVGCTAGSRDLTEGMFRHLVVTGRSRLALYLARIPAGLAIVASLVAVGYAIVCAVCALAAPAFVTDNGVNIPPGLSRAAFANWADGHAELVICNFPDNGPVPGSVDCPSGPGTSSVSAVTPGQAAPAPLEALAVKIAGQDYPGYAGILRAPPVSVMIEAGLWNELEAVVGFTLGLGLASLMGQRTVPVILLIMLQLILTPILSGPGIASLQALQRLFVGPAVAHLEPSGLPAANGLPGVTGGVGGPGSVRLPESATEAVCVIIAWLAAWTLVGAWRMTTRDVLRYRAAFRGRGTRIIRPWRSGSCRATSGHWCRGQRLHPVRAGQVRGRHMAATSPQAAAGGRLRGAPHRGTIRPRTGSRLPQARPAAGWLGFPVPGGGPAQASCVAGSAAASS